MNVSGTESQSNHRLLSWVGYPAAILLEAVLTTALLLIYPYLPLGGYPVYYFLITMVVAYYFGAGPAVLAVVIGLFAYDYFFIAPLGSLFPIAETPAGWAGVIAYTIGTTIVAIATTLIRSSKRRAERLAAELRESGTNYRELVQNANSAIIRWESDGTLTFFNEHAQRLFGYTEEEAVGSNVAMLLPETESTGADLTELVHDIVEHPDRYLDNVNENVRRDGTRLWMSWTNRPIRDSEGRVCGILAVGTDVTARKNAEDALRESEAKYRYLFENMAEEVHFWKLVRDEQGSIRTWLLVDANPPTLKTWGKSIEEIRGRTTDEIFGPGATEHYMPVVRKIITEGVPYSYEDYFPNLGKHFRFTSVPLGDYFITTGADITGAKQAREELRIQRQLLETVVNNIPAQIEVMRGSDFRIQLVNPAYQAIAPGKEMIGKTLDEVWPELDRNLVDLSRKVLETGEPYEAVDDPVDISRYPGGPTERRYFTWSLIPVDLPGGQGRGILNMSFETTERKMSEEAVITQAELLMGIIQNIPVYLVIWDGRLRQINFNEAFRREMGWTEADAAEGDFLAKIYPDQERRREAEAFARSAQPGFRDFRTTAKDGRLVDISWANIQLDGDRSIGIGVNITERKQAEEEIARANRELAARAAQVQEANEQLAAANEELVCTNEELETTTEELRQEAEDRRKAEEKVWQTLESIGDGFLALDGEWRFIYINAIGERLLGLDRDEVLGRSFWEVLPDAKGSLLETEYLLAAAGESRDFEYLHQPWDRWFRHRCYRREGGGMSAYFQDITDRKQAEEREQRDEAEKLAFYRRTIEAATNGKLVICESGEIERMAGPADATWEIRGTHDIAVVRHGASDLARSLGIDPMRLTKLQVAVGEAVTNAVKHASGGEASARRLDDGLLVVVSDHGPGIPAMALPDVALRLGFSTAGTLGMGYKIMIEFADRVLLATGEGGTTVAMEFRKHPATPGSAPGLPAGIGA